MRYKLAIFDFDGTLADSYSCKPRLLRRVLRATGVQPAEALCIGDEIRDLRAASAVGIPFGAVAWGYTRIEALEAHAPREVFSRVDEIPRKFA